MGISTPEPGLVICYSYLWRREALRGQVEGRKDRPCVIVLAVVGRVGEEPLVVVAPITHSPPADPEWALEIPPKVKAHLGLDGERSWVVVNEFNEFRWPGFDLRPIPGSRDRFDFGHVPPRFMERVRERIRALEARGRSPRTSRDEV